METPARKVRRRLQPFSRAMTRDYPLLPRSAGLSGEKCARAKLALCDALSVRRHRCETQKLTNGGRHGDLLPFQGKVPPEGRGMGSDGTCVTARLRAQIMEISSDPLRPGHSPSEGRASFRRPMAGPPPPERGGSRCARVIRHMAFRLQLRRNCRNELTQPISQPCRDSPPTAPRNRSNPAPVTRRNPRASRRCGAARSRSASPRRSCSQAGRASRASPRCRC